jgi:hypothetical protein
MHALDHGGDPAAWAALHFGDVALDDERRSRRLVAVAEAFAQRPGLSLPQTFAAPGALKAFYRLMASADVEPDTLQEPHRHLVAEQMRAAQEVLLLEDTSEIDYSQRQRIEGLGPIGNSNLTTQGIHLHSTLAACWSDPSVCVEQQRRPPVQLLGIADQIFHQRVPRPAGERAGAGSRARAGRERESQLWQQAGERIGPAPHTSRWVRVCDAGADIYEVLVSCVELGHGFAINAAQNRVVLERAEGPRRGLLLDLARAAPRLGEVQVAVASRPGRPAREARLELGVERVWVAAPARARGSAQRPAIECTLVHAREVGAPGGQEPIEWCVLYDQEVKDLAGARRVTLQYASRYLIEEFHKALKTGLKVEEAQLASAHGLSALIAVLSVVAMRLLNLRETCRRDATAPAEQSGMSTLELEVLRTHLNRPILTVAEVALAIARLGGHLNRKGDGPPGWLTLWRGMNTLTLLVEGVKLARTLNAKKSRKCG